MKGISWKDPLVFRDEVRIPFIDIDPTPGGSNLGRAEFDFCPIFRNGFLVQMFIQRRQQRTDERFYLVDDLNSASFRFAWADHLEPLAPWRYCRCKTHKSTLMSIYTPDGTTAISVDRSSIQTTFRFS